MVTKGSITLYFREKIIFRFTIASLVLAIVSTFWIFYKLRAPGSFNPLHYNIFFGIDRIGPWYVLLRYPLAVCGALLLNFYMGYIIFPQDKYLSYYLLFMAFMSSCILALFLIFLTSYAY